MARYFQSKYNGITIDDEIIGLEHTWSASKIAHEIASNITGELDVLELKHLQDVSIPNPENQQLLSFNSSTGKWVARTLTLTTKMSELTDVNLSGIKDNYILKYDSSSGYFKSTDIKMGDLFDFTEGNKRDGYFIRYDSNSNGYVNSPPPNILELSDVNPSGLLNRSVLQYSLAESKFKVVQMFGLNDLRNVVTDEMEDGYVLAYDSDTSTYRFKELDAKTELRELMDVNVTVLEDGDIVRYSEEQDKFINTSLNLNTLDDVDFTEIQDGYVLRYSDMYKKFIVSPPDSKEGDTIINNNKIEQHITETNYGNTSQVLVENVIASPESPYEVKIDIGHTEDYNVGKIEVLKFEESKEKTNEVNTFNEEDYECNKELVEFGNSIRVKNSLVYESTEKEEISENENIYTIPLDLSMWESIDSIEII